ncbi:UV-endonuclease UvdE [uncultured delta proteobacterium]|uniref:UV-endonuclease UvdE n=1 Tax=uncultured delta proteobacterium TaxID=34034 RepID=A0A212IXX1_9DELT|nr:UV-endonuclease UvdE [uncultured delta proteobacterium]
MIRYGFACKTIGVPGAEQTTLALGRADEEQLLRAGRRNLRALDAMVRYCRAEGIRLMRISSDVIPLASHPGVSFDWQHLLQEELAAIATLIADTGVRVSMHPGQYTVLNSPRDDVVERAVEDLRFHADFLGAVGADMTARIILHLGGGYGDKQAALRRLARNIETLPAHIRNRLALENDERIYTIEDVLAVCGEFALPAVFDVYHHAINPPPHGATPDWLDKAALTWEGESGRQKIHYSQQWPGGKPGMHSQSISMDAFLPFHAGLRGRELDVMLEVKDKNLSAVKCANLTAPDLPRRKLTDEWARYKYLVLEHDPAAYNEIRALLRDNEPDAAGFYNRLEKALGKTVAPGHARNAAQHVWGYVDKLASAAESRRVLADIAALDGDARALPRLKNKLLALAAKHEREYLLRSLYFYL